ncbi:MAG: lysine-sensitive aspartokinase 3 [Acidobacteriota bacterium]
MIVMKFGGTSVGSAAAIKRVAEIVRGRLAARPTIVVSALAGVTNQLLECAKLAAIGEVEQTHKILQQLILRHSETARELLGKRADERAIVALDALFAELRILLDAVCVLHELTPRSSDAIVAYGERLSALLVAEYFEVSGIPSSLLDAREFIITDERFSAALPIASELEPRTRNVIHPVIEAGRVVVTQGFIGATRGGVTTTIGRGGSDYTAALIGAAIGAELIEIWTDVDGLLTGDPRILKDVKKLKVIGFNEAAELAYFGAKVLHPATVLPAIRENIPVYILNSQRPAGSGTRIVAQAPACRNTIKAIACRRGITVVQISSTRMLMAYGFLKRIFEIFDKYETAVDVVSTSEVSVSLTLDSTEKLATIVEELTVIGEVSVEPARAIICVVGTDIRYKSGVAGRLFKCIEHINVDMISQGASHINITLVVAESDLVAAVAALHEEFFRETDPDVFETVAN